MGMKEDVLALADELEAFEDGDCEECILHGKPDCKIHLTCAEIIARYAARKIREAVEHDAEDATTVSAYDLLSEDDRKALAWVREMGGLEQTSLDFAEGMAFGDIVDDIAARLGVSVAGLDSQDARYRIMPFLDRRLMPDGMEWPKYTDGSPVEIGDTVIGPDYGERINVDAVKFHANGFTLYDKNGFDKWYEDDDVFERPTPKVLDADGVEIRVGDEVWNIDTGAHGVVVYAHDYDGMSVKFGGVWHYPARCTHRAPVIAADGKPLREGEHVWHVETGTELVVKRLPEPGEYQAVVVFAPPASHLASFDPDQLTHERPEIDSWERLEDDATRMPGDYCERYGIGGESYPMAETMAQDLVRRARKLAEMGA